MSAYPLPPRPTRPNVNRRVPNLFHLGATGLVFMFSILLVNLLFWTGLIYGAVWVLHHFGVV